MNSLPKYCIACTQPDAIWGIARLRTPCIIVEFARINIGGIIGDYQPLVWPPDAIEQTTLNKFNNIMTKMWRILENENQGCDEVRMYQFDLTRPLPQFLVLDNEGSDFTGVLDTQRGLLWVVDETGYGLKCDMDFKMHPHSPPKHEFPLDAREASEFYRAFLELQKQLEDEY